MASACATNHRGRGIDAHPVRRGKGSQQVAPGASELHDPTPWWNQKLVNLLETPMIVSPEAVPGIHAGRHGAPALPIRRAMLLARVDRFNTTGRSGILSSSEAPRRGAIATHLTFSSTRSEERRVGKEGRS